MRAHAEKAHLLLLGICADSQPDAAFIMDSETKCSGCGVAVIWISALQIAFRCCLTYLVLEDWKTFYDNE